MTMEEHLAQAQKTIAAYEGFSQVTGMDLTKIRSPKPLESDNPQKEILSRIVDSLQKHGDGYLTLWENIFPSRDLIHTRALIAIQLELLSDKMVEPLLGQKTAQLIPIQSITRVAAIATGIAGIASQLAPTSSGIRSGIQTIAPTISITELPDIPAFQALQKELVKTFKPKAWEKSPSNGMIECTLGNLDASDKMGAAHIIQTLEKDLEKVGDRGEILADWAGKTAERIVGEKMTDAFRDEIKIVKDFFIGNSKEEWDNKKKLLLAATVPAAFFAPAILAVPAAFLMIGIVAQSLFSRAKEWRDREIEPLEERTQKMKEVHGEGFEPLQAPWLSKIFKAAQEEGADISYPKPKDNGSPTDRIVIVGESHEREENPIGYKGIIEGLAKKGFRQISMEQPPELLKDYEDAFQTLKPEDDISGYTQILQCYCLARRAGMTVSFVDCPEKELDANQEKYTTALKDQVAANGEPTDPSRISTTLGGPKAIEGLLYRLDFHMGKPREEIMAKALVALSQKGPVAHFGGAAHNAPLQDRIATATGQRPLSIILESQDKPSRPLPESKNSFSIQAEQAMEAIQRAVSNPAPKKSAEPEIT